MSIRSRRDSLRKSAIGVDSIRKSVTGLSEGLVSIGRQSSELLKQTRKTNLFKSKLIRQDAEFFKRRRENVLRKQREDELEATSITGVTKRQGNIIQKSTRGFLGRILDFVGTLIIGWALLNLPKIIDAFQKLFKLITRVVGVFTGFIDGMKNFFESLGTGIDNVLSTFSRFDFREDDKNIRETIDKTEANLTKLNTDFTEAVQSFARDKDLASAEQVAKDIGAIDSSEIEMTDEEIKSIAKKAAEDSPVESIEGKSMGGEVESKVPYIVGEEGPEIFTPEVKGTIIPNNQLDENIEGSEIFTPDAKGTIISNNQLDKNIEGTNTIDDDLVAVNTEDESIEGVNTMSDEDMQLENELDGVEEAVIPKKSGQSVSGGSFSMPQGNNEKLEPESITPQKLVKSIIPVKKELNNLKGRKKPRTTFIINNQNQTSTAQIPSMSKKIKKIVSSGYNSKQTLLDFQSILLK